MKSSSAAIEWLVGVIRVGPAGWHYGDPYEWCATIKQIDPTTVELTGVVRCPTRGQWRAIQDVLLGAGFRRAIWKRVSKGKTRVVEFTPALVGEDGK